MTRPAMTPKKTVKICLTANGYRGHNYIFVLFTIRDFYEMSPNFLVQFGSIAEVSQRHFGFASEVSGNKSS